jgi:hypothetical protein
LTSAGTRASLFSLPPSSSLASSEGRQGASRPPSRRLDALYAHLYGLSHDELAYILGTFPIFRRIVERGGKSCVVVISVDEYERLVRGQQPQDWKGLVAQARAQIQADWGGRELPPPEEILRQIREERDAQLLAVH